MLTVSRSWRATRNVYSQCSRQISMLICTHALQGMKNLT